MAVTTGQPDAPAYAIDDLLADGDLTGVAWCEARTARTDAYLLALYGAAGSPAGTALVALGGYGRGDLCPRHGVRRSPVPHLGKRGQPGPEVR